MDIPTKIISQYVQEKGINISKMSRITEISYAALYDSLVNKDRDRDLRAGELLSVCTYLGLNPADLNEERVK